MPVSSVLRSGMQIDVEQAIRGAAAAFEEHHLVFGHGTDDAISEASWLVLHAMSLSPLQAPDYKQQLTEAQIQQCNSLIARRINERIPAAYITGSTWFAGLSFKADSRALVPRSPLAEFIVNDFFELINPHDVNAVLDLCTGGGCIGIACAVYLAHAQVDASDLSAEALSLAAENVALHEMQDRMNLIKSDLFDNVQKRYDLIISNPPYVDANDIDAMSKEFEHEPLMGLAAGKDGLDLVRHMLHEAADYLTENGLLVVEVGNSAQALEDTYPEVPFLWLEFESGGSGIFAISAKELRQHANDFAAALPAL